MPLQELSSEGSDCRCIFDSDFDYDFDSIYANNLSAWFALIVVQNRTEQTAANGLITARYAENLDIDRKATNANPASATNAELQDTQHPNAHVANAAARPTKAL